LGLALHKSLGEIRAMPYPEFCAWQTYYMLEPWGWENNEYLFGMLAARIYNNNVSKSKDAKDASAFMRDMDNLVLDALKEKPNLEDLPIEKRREVVIAAIKKDFGIK
jgi:hypothetical protein